ANAKKIVPKVKKDPIFIPIISKLTIPFNIENDIQEDEEKNIDLKEQINKEKEDKAKAHLEEMFDITRNLSYSDIEMLNRNKIKKIKKEKNGMQKENLNENYREY